ncbi:unnamed protein product, partial [Toxocara canis]
MVSTTSFDSAAMLPAPCFYPSSQPPKWATNEDNSASTRFPAVDVKYSSSEQQFRYPPEMRWPAEFPYQFPFTTHATVAESYPTDPFPSTSVALPNTYKMESGCYYPNTMIPSAYAAATSTDYFTASQQFSQWKMPSAVHAASSIKSTARVSGSTSATPPYRTGPGTNNVRVRTSEKYRMVYTDFQRLELEKEFRTTQFINSERKSQLSSELQLTERQIKIWFQN